MSRYLFFVLVLLSLGLVFFSCNKDSKDSGFGVSISAPKMLGTPAERLSQEQVQALRVSNSLCFSFLNRQYVADKELSSFSFSPLELIPYVYYVSDSNYTKAFFQHYSISDSVSFMQAIFSSASLASEIDSLLKSSTSMSSSLGSFPLSLEQEFSFIMPYEGMLKSLRRDFFTLDTAKVKLPFYEIWGNFGLYRNENKLCLDIPVSNGNYSLLILIAEDWDIRTLTLNFTELMYKEIVEGLTYQNIKISFPDISSSLSFPLLLPDMGEEKFDNNKHLLIKSKLSLIKPTQAFLEVQQTHIDHKLQQGSISEHLFVNKPFIYIIRGNGSNTILHLGVFLGK